MKKVTLSLAPYKLSAGFTLIELILVIVILGVMSAGIGGFITLTTQTYINVTERDEIVASARFSIERLNRELRNAVPNSVRVNGKAGSTPGNDMQCLEFVPIVASTVYTDIPVNPEPKSSVLSVIEFADVDDNDYQCSSNCTDRLIVYPLISDDIFANQQDDTGKAFAFDSVTPTAVDGEWTIGLESILGVKFDDDSPTNRLYIFNTPVSYCVSDTIITRYQNYGFYLSQPLPPNDANTQSSLMAESLVEVDLDNTATLPFAMSEATLLRNALVTIQLSFTRDDEDYVFNNEVHIHNVP